MANKHNINTEDLFDKTDVQQYLQMIQDAINRMSSNCSGSKNLEFYSLKNHCNRI